MWHKADWMGHPMRLELTLAGLLVKLANHYTTRGAQMSWWKCSICSSLKSPQFFGKKAKYDHRKFSLIEIHAPSWWKLFSRSSISFSYATLQWFPRKFVTTDFSDCQADSSALLSALLNIGSFISSLIWKLLIKFLLAYPCPVSWG